MNSKKLYYVLVSVLALATVGLVGGAYGANTILQQQSQKLAEARFKSQSLETQQTQLIKAEKEIEKYKELGDIARAIVPQDKDQAQTVREIVKIAAASGVKLGSITFPTSNLGTALPKPAATPTEAGATASPKPAAPLQSQLKAVPNIAGVFDLAITVQSQADDPVLYSNFLRFLEGLEKNRRTALVTGITITPDPEAIDRVSFTLNINEYIKP